MKNLFVILFAILPIVAAAQTMCVRDNSLVISLDVSILGTDYGANLLVCHAALAQHAQQVFGIDQILCAAEGDETDFRVHGVSPQNRILTV